jgi:hypothetical protein
VRRVVRALRSCVSSPADVWLLGRIAAWAVVLPLAKRVIPLPRLVAAMAAEPKRADRDPELERRIARMARLVYRGRRPTFRDNCLERSLVTYRYLGRAGARPRLLVGLGRGESGAIRGHAWVVLDGRAVHDGDDALEPYAEVAAFGPDGRRVSGVSSPPPGADRGAEPRHEPERPPRVGGD